LQTEGGHFSRPPLLNVVATTIGQRPGAEVTRALLENIASGVQGARLRAQVAGWHREARGDQVEDAFQEACARAERSCRGQTEGEVYTWLRTTMHRELGHMRHRARREVLVDVCAPGFDAADRSTPGPDEQLIAREDEAELEHVTGALLARLSHRDREIAALHSHGLRRPQIAERLGITNRAVKRALERIMAAGRDELVRIAGRGCETGEGVVARLAFGLAGAAEVREAQAHLATCTRCGALFERLDLWREKVAVLVPLPAAAHAHPATGEWLHGVVDALASARRHVAEGVAQLKAQASAVYYRVADPTPLAGVRPGATAAAIAGCVAVGGGATYCVQESVNPLDRLTAITGFAHHKSPRRTHAPRARAAQAQQPVVATPTPAPVAVQPAPPPAPPPPPAATPPPPSAEQEFLPSGSTGGTSNVSSSSPASSPKTAKPAAAPAGGAGEFGGP